MKITQSVCSLFFWNIIKGDCVFLVWPLCSFDVCFQEALRKYQKSLKVCFIILFSLCKLKSHPDWVWEASPFFLNYHYFSGTSSPEWIPFQEAEYKFFDHRTTWDQAQRICSWFDSSLTSVHSADEQAFLANTLRKVQHGSSQRFLLWVKEYWIKTLSQTANSHKLLR